MTREVISHGIEEPKLGTINVSRYIGKTMGKPVKGYKFLIFTIIMIITLTTVTIITMDEIK